MEDSIMDGGMLTLMFLSVAGILLYQSIVIGEKYEDLIWTRIVQHASAFLLISTVVSLWGPKESLAKPPLDFLNFQLWSFLMYGLSLGGAYIVRKVVLHKKPDEWAAFYRPVEEVKDDKDPTISPEMRKLLNLSDED